LSQTLRSAYPANEVTEFLLHRKAQELAWLKEIVCPGHWPDQLSLPELTQFAAYRLLEDVCPGYLGRSLIIQAFQAELRDMGNLLAADDTLLMQLIVLERRWVTCTYANRVFELESGRCCRETPPPPIETTSYNLTRFLKLVHGWWEKRYGNQLAPQAAAPGVVD
jgi:hypothetical protein